MSPIEELETAESPREILEADFKSLGGALPITGGWGYTKADACVIERDDPAVNKAIPFDGYAIQKIFIEKRLYEEMIIFRRPEEKYSGIEWKLMKQELHHDAGRIYDKMVFTVTALPDAQLRLLKAEWEGPSGFIDPSFDRAAHLQKRQSLMLKITKEYWFDITSFYGK